MMDSQETILEQGKQEEVIQVPEQNSAAAEEVQEVQETVAPEVETVETAQEETPRKVYETKQEVLDRVKEIAHGDEAPQKD